MLICSRCTICIQRAFPGSLNPFPSYFLFVVSFSNTNTNTIALYCVRLCVSSFHIQLCIKSESKIYVFDKEFSIRPPYASPFPLFFTRHEERRTTSYAAHAHEFA